jgi:hypothetical protein
MLRTTVDEIFKIECCKIFINYNFKSSWLTIMNSKFFKLNVV